MIYEYLINLGGTLDVEETNKRIKKENIPELNNKLKGDSDAHLKFIGTLDVAQTKKIIEEQLSTLDLKANLDLGSIKINITDIESQLNTVESHAQHTGNVLKNALSSLGGNGKLASINAPKEGSIRDIYDISYEGTIESIEKIVDNLRQYGDVSKTIFRNSKDDVTGFTVSIKNSNKELGQFLYKLDTLYERDDDGNLVKENGEPVIKDRVFALSRSVADENNIKLLEEQRNQIEKNTIAVSKYLNVIKQKQSAYSDPNASKPITDEEHLAKLNEKYKTLETTIENFNGATKSNYATIEQEVKNQIADLDSMVKQFRNSETLATDWRAKPIETIANMKGNELDKFIADVTKAGLETSVFANDINALQNSFSKVFDANGVVDANALNNFMNQLDEMKSKLKSLTTQSNAVNQIGASLKTLTNLSNQTTFFKNQDNNKVIALKQNVNSLNAEFEILKNDFAQSGMTDELARRFVVLSQSIQKTSAFARELKVNLTEGANANKLLSDKSTLDNRITMWLKTNTKAGSELQGKLVEIRKQIKSADREKLTQLQQEFKKTTQYAAETGQVGQSFMDMFKEKVSKFSAWFSLSQVIMTTVSQIREAINTLREMDSILTEISKTSNRTKEDLERLGSTSFAVANKYGVTAQSYLTGIQEMSRAGFGDKTAETMAELALLTEAAGDVTAETAQDYLIATNAAYDLGGSEEKLLAILDGQNQITNRNAVSMYDMAEATKEAASIASQYGVSIEQLSAMIATATSRTRENGAETGNAIKSLLVNFSDVTNNNIVKAFDAVGISMTEMVGDSQQLKNPIQLLRELADAFNSLPEGDEKRAIILNDIGGKYRANTLAALLSGIDDFDKIMNDYAEGAGSAQVEAAKSAENWAGSLNRLNNSFVGLVQNIADSDSITGFINKLAQGIQYIDEWTESIGGLRTALFGLSTITTSKVLGNILPISANSTDTGKINDFSTNAQDMLEVSQSIMQARQYLQTGRMSSADFDEFYKSTYKLNDEMLHFIKTTDVANLNLENMYANSLNVTHGYSNVNDIIHHYQSLKTPEQQQAFAKAVGQTNTNLGKYLTNVKSADANIGSYGLSLVTATLKTVGLQIATTALNAAISFGLSIAFQGLITWIDKLIVTEKEATEKAKEQAEEQRQAAEEARKSSDEYKKSVKSINDYIKTFSEMRSTTSLTSSEKSKLLDIQEQLVDTYGSEVKGIDLVNGKYDEQLVLLRNLSKAKSEQWLYDSEQSRLQSESDYNNNRSNSILKTTNKEVLNSATDFKDKIMETIANEVEGFNIFEYEDTSNLFENAFLKEQGLLPTELILSQDMTSAEKVEALSQALDVLRNNFSETEKKTKEYQDTFNRLNGLLNDYRNEVDTFNADLKNQAEATLANYILSEDIDVTSFTKDTYTQFKVGLINSIRDKDGNLDKELHLAILDVLKEQFSDFEFNTITVDEIFSFDYANYSEDIDNLTSDLSKLQKVYDKLVEGKATDTDIMGLLKDFPELAPYVGDADSLRKAMMDLANTSIQPLITQLTDLKSKLTDPQQISAVESLITGIRRMGNLTNVYKTAQDVLDENIKSIDGQIDSIKLKKEAEESYIESLETEKDRLEDMSKLYDEAYKAVTSAIDEEISAIEKRNEEQKKANDLKEKELALDKAKNTKVKVYSASRGYTIQTDTEAVKKAQKEYDEAIGDTEVDELKAYKEEWEKAANSFTEAQNEMSAAAVFGADWRERVLNKDVGTLTTYKTNYNNLQNQIHNVITPQINDAKNLVSAYDKQIDKYEELKKEQQSYLDFFKTYSDDIAFANKKQAQSVRELANAIAMAGQDSSSSRGLDDRSRGIIAGLFATVDELFNLSPKLSFASGGVNSTTGQANLHGTNQRSEVIFNSGDAKKLYDIIHNNSASGILNKIGSNFVESANSMMNNVQNNNSNSSNTIYNWTITGNEINADKYEVFKSYMDRFVRESQMNLNVGKR